MNLPRSLIISAVTFLGGVYFFLEFLLPAEFTLPLSNLSIEFGKYHETISQGLIVISVSAIGLALISLVAVHGRRIIKGQRHSGYSIILLAALTITFTAEILTLSAQLNKRRESQRVSQYAEFVERLKPNLLIGDKEAKAKLNLLNGELERVKSFALPNVGANSESCSECIEANQKFAQALSEINESLNSSTFDDDVINNLVKELQALSQLFNQLLQRAEPGVSEKVNSFLYDSIFVPLGSAMFSLLAFYISTAAYRAFRIRSREAAIMMGSAVIVMLGQIPFGPLYISEDLPAIRRWMFEHINTPAFRAIFFGSVIAGFGVALRMWLSLERSPHLEEASTERQKRGGQ